MKMTTVSMDWTDKGATRLVSMDWTDKGATCLSSSGRFSCPRCGTQLQPNIEHLCGDRIPKPANVKRKSSKRPPEAK